MAEPDEGDWQNVGQMRRQAAPEEGDWQNVGDMRRRAAMPVPPAAATPEPTPPPAPDTGDHPGFFRRWASNTSDIFFEGAETFRQTPGRMLGAAFGPRQATEEQIEGMKAFGQDVRGARANQSQVLGELFQGMGGFIQAAAAFPFGLYRTAISQPLEKSIGVPHEITELGGQLALGALGGEAAAKVPRAADGRPIMSRMQVDADGQVRPQQIGPVPPNDAEFKQSADLVARMKAAEAAEPAAAPKPKPPEPPAEETAPPKVGDPEGGPVLPADQVIVEANLRRGWEEDGIHPAEAVDAAQNDAFARHDLTTEPDPVIVDSDTFNMLRDSGTLSPAEAAAAEPLPTLFPKDAAGIIPRQEGPAFLFGRNELLRGQPFSTLNEAIARAPARQTELVNALRDTARDATQNRAEVKDPGYKTNRARMVQKIATKYEGYTKGLTDLVRGGLTINTPADAEAIAAHLGRKYRVIDEGWNVTDVGYLDRKLEVVLPDGTVSEVQLWPKEILDAKSDGHKLYEKRRTAPVEEREAMREQEIAFWKSVHERLDPAWRGVLTGGSPNFLSQEPYAVRAASSDRGLPSQLTSAELTSRQPLPEVPSAKALPVEGSATATLGPQPYQRSAAIEEPSTQNIGAPIGAGKGSLGVPVPNLPAHKVTAGNGQQVTVAFRVVEAAELRTSADAGYPKELQPRQRERAASQQQIGDIASKLDPERLGMSAEADRGAPIVGPDGLVESGNGRVLALRQVYDKGGDVAQRYRDFITRTGVDASQFKEPVLIRERTSELSPEDRARFTVGANQSTILAMGATERAVADAKMITPEMLDLVKTPDDLGAPSNSAFHRAFMGKLPKTELGALVDADGHLSSEGLVRIRNAMLARAYGNDPILTRIAESVHDEVKSISNTLVTVASRWAKLRAEVEAGRVAPDMDITRELVEAVRRTADLRARGIPLREFLAQSDPFDNLTTRVERFMRAFYDEGGGRTASMPAMKADLTAYIEHAMKVPAEAGLDLGLEPVTPESLQLRMLGGKATYDQGVGLFAPKRAGVGEGIAARGGQPERPGTPGSRQEAGTGGPGQDQGGQDPAVEGAKRSVGAAVNSQAPELPLEQQAPVPPGRLAAATHDLLDKAFDLGNDAQMLVTPMAARSATPTARAILKDLANALRRNRWEWARKDQWLVKTFDRARRKLMWNQADEESVLQQMTRAGEELPEPVPGEARGLAALRPAERAAIEEMHRDAEVVWAQVRDAGMVEGEGLPAYTPRMVINTAAALGEDRAVSLNSIGANLRTRVGQMMRRKYLLAEETEAAAKERFGEDAELARDIRTLPLATARLQDALAGYRMIQKLKDIGRQTGTDVVSEGSMPATDQKWFTLDHPAFRRWRPKLGELADGTYGALKDEAGNNIFEQVPLYVRGDFEGPLRAVLTQRNGAIYNAFMGLKGKTMGLIMNSPAIHNLVEWGRALPAMPGKVVTGRIYFQGNAVRRGIPYRNVVNHVMDWATGRQVETLGGSPDMVEAINHGLVPIGQRFFNHNVEDIMREPDLAPGDSITAKLLGAVPGLFSEGAGDAVKTAVDRAGNFWHNTLLWDRIADLQAGLYVNFRDEAIGRGVDRNTAAYMAAHMANRFAGALPTEAMSANARKISNVLLFSRSFTFGNLGVMKDMLTGLPRDVIAQIERDGGLPEGAIARGEPGTEGAQAAAKYARSLTRRRAIAVLAADIGLYYVTNSILQNVANVWFNDSTLDQELHGYATRFREALQSRVEHPLSIIQPFDFLDRLSATYSNEPDRQNRIRIGNAADGTAIYLRNPVGKIGEEFTGWMTGQLDMLRKKLSPAARPLLETISNSQGFGQKVYNPSPQTIPDYIDSAKAIAEHFAKAQFPEGQLSALTDLVKGDGDPLVNKLQAFGPVAGFTFAKGAPGGPAVGELYHDRAMQDFRVQKELPDIRLQIQRGDIIGAQNRMIDLGIAPGLQRFIIRSTLNPSTRLGGRTLRDFYRYATPEQQERLLNAK